MPNLYNRVVFSEYVLEDGTEFILRKNTVYGLEPKFLIRDFMKRQPEETLYALYYDVPGNGDFRFLRTTGKISDPCD